MLRNSPFFQLYRARLREFYRQPARIFWVYGFPLLLASVLGFAFQSRPPAPIQVDLVDSPFSAKLAEAIARHNDRIARSKASPADPLAAILPPVSVELKPEHEANERLNKGKTVLEIVPSGATPGPTGTTPPVPSPPRRGRSSTTSSRRPAAASTWFIPTTNTSPSRDHGTSIA